MKNSVKPTGLFFLLLAGAIILAHQVIPHHHHYTGCLPHHQEDPDREVRISGDFSGDGHHCHAFNELFSRKIFIRPLDKVPGEMHFDWLPFSNFQCFFSRGVLPERFIPRRVAATPCFIFTETPLRAPPFLS